jgi:hypothetical protein
MDWIPRPSERDLPTVVLTRTQWWYSLCNQRRRVLWRDLALFDVEACGQIRSEKRDSEMKLFFSPEFSSCRQNSQLKQRNPHSLPPVLAASELLMLEKVHLTRWSKKFCEIWKVASVKMHWNTHRHIVSILLFRNRPCALRKCQPLGLVKQTGEVRSARCRCDWIPLVKLTQSCLNDCWNDVETWVTKRTKIQHGLADLGNWIAADQR